MTNYVRNLGCLTLIVLLAGCGGGSSSKTPIKEDVNLAPVAQFVVSKSEVAENETVTFDANDSTDPDGDTLSYQWQVINSVGDVLALEDNSSKTLSFTPTDFGDYTVELVVSDGKLSSVKASSVISVMPSGEDYPSAKITGANSTKIGSTNWLSGEQSVGAHGQLVSYEWIVADKPEGSEPTLGDTSNVRAYFVADMAGEYQISLKVTNNDDGLSQAQLFNIQVDELTANSSPTAIVLYTQRNYAPEETIYFDGSTSFDPDGDILTKQWQLVTQPENSKAELASEEGELNSLKVDVVGDYQVKLVVRDNNEHDESVVDIQVTQENIVPVARAGDDKVAVLNIDIELDGSASSDAEGQTLQYEWSLVSRPENSEYDELNTPELKAYSKFMFKPDVVGLYTLSLRVFDGEDFSLADHVTVEVSENIRPVAVLPDDVVVNDGDIILISAADSYDAENQPLSYQWEILNAPENFQDELGSPDPEGDSPIATLTPTEVGNYTIQLVVNDGTQDSVPETMVIVREDDIMYSREVTGRIVNSAGNPVSGVSIGGILQRKDETSENGEFAVTMANKSDTSPALTILQFNVDGDIRGYLRIADYSEAPLELGDVYLPVLQRKDITLQACDTFEGPESLKLTFVPQSTGYENVRFIQGYSTEFKIGEVVQMVLPATAELAVRSSNLSYSVTTLDGDTLFMHDYQQDDNQLDSLTLTVCN